MTHDQAPMRILLTAAILGLCLAAGCSRKPLEVKLVAETQITHGGSDTEIEAMAPSETVAKRAIAAANLESGTCYGRLNPDLEPSAEWRKGDEAARKDPHQAPSDVWLINHLAGQSAADVDGLTLSCLAAAKEIYEASHGAFDPTVGPIIELWIKAEAEGREPAPEEIAQARRLLGMDRLSLGASIVSSAPPAVVEPNARTPRAAPPAPPAPPKMAATGYSAGLPEAGMRLDLGGIVKGYVAGRMVQRMKQAGAVAGMVTEGGCRVAFGERPPYLAPAGEDPAWTVIVPDPRDPDVTYTSIRLKDASSYTSRWLYRGYAIGGKHFSHIIDPKTGRPVASPIASVTVISPDATLAQAMATAIPVLGVKDGLEMVAARPGAECLILEVGPPAGSPPGTPPPPADASGLVPEEATLIPHRSAGFAALEVPAAEK